MMTASQAGRQPFDEPALYQIQVRGALEAAWSDRLEGMKLSVSAAGRGYPVTTLCGELPDQAALAGVLSQLYILRLSVLSVERLEDVSNDMNLLLPGENDSRR